MCKFINDKMISFTIVIINTVYGDPANSIFDLC